MIAIGNDMKQIKEKILIITPDYMDYTDIIRIGIAEYLEC